MTNQAFRYLTQKCAFEEIQQVLREYINSVEQTGIQLFNVGIPGNISHRIF